MFVFGPPGTVPTFARSFGYMNLAGVTIQLLFPCSAPWYENMYGLAPANYSMPGSPAGLAAIDRLLGFDMYTSTFTASPLVFGAFPSLHAANATIEALFMSHVFPKLKPLFILYALWICWATMYLSHHYAVDLVAGSVRESSIYLEPEILLLTDIQLLALHFSSPNPISSPEYSSTKCSAGTTITQKSAKPMTATPTVSPISTASPLLHSTAMNGPSDPLRRFHPVIVALRLASGARRMNHHQTCGTAILWHPVPTLKLSDSTAQYSTTP